MSRSIKGGGRASLSEEARDTLIGLLLSIREPEKYDKIESDHDKKHAYKNFLKKMVARSERRSLAATVNSSAATENGGGDVAGKVGIALQLNAVEGKASQDGANLKNDKVRIVLVEAIFGVPTKGKNKRKTERHKDEKSSTKNGIDFKEGNNKTMALPRGTTVEEVMKQAKSKLRMKKNPTRCFIVGKQILVDLTGNLMGIRNDSKLYVSSCEETTQKEDEISPGEMKEGAESEIFDAAHQNGKDPLDSVKESYRRRKWISRGGSRRTNTTCAEKGLPRLGDSLGNLSDLSPDRAKLPAAAARADFLTALDVNRVVIVTGETGSGKSTQIPLYIFEGLKAAGHEQRAHILVTQPRRVAATSLATRVAQEIKSPQPGAKGSIVGYNVRLDRAVSETAKIVYCTVGILLRMLVCPDETDDKFIEDGECEHVNENRRIPLSNVTHIVIDEVHERDINTDFVLTLLRVVLRRNEHIRVILMSATASADLFVRYFDAIGMKPFIIKIPGRTFPVDIRWLPSCESYAGAGIVGWTSKENPDSKASNGEERNQMLSPRATTKIDNAFICKLIRAIIQEQRDIGDLNKVGAQPFRTNGAILVFLPGKMEIDALARTLYSDQLVGDRKLCKVLKLSSSVTKEDQRFVFLPAHAGTVKVVLATNIAETSITIPDVSHVVDTGRVKESRFNSATRIKELVTVWTSQASAKQRAGRAGRVSAGTCWRLFTEDFCTEQVPPQTCPEILRSPVDELVMQICLLFEHQRDSSEENLKGVCPMRFLGRTPEPPPPKTVLQACKHLLEVGAIRVVTLEPVVLYRLTPLGYHLARLPMDSKVGKVLLVGCILGCLDNALTVAAALSVTKSCFPSRFSNVKDVEWEKCVQARKDMVESGFGGPKWIGAASGQNTLKGDMTATIAAFRNWQSQRSNKDRAVFCSKHAIDSNAMQDIHRLRHRFMDCLADNGFVDLNNGSDLHNDANDDALLTSCCLVAGLYPNLCTLMRPRRGGPKGGRLITKEEDICKTSSSSFLTQRLKNASENGIDAYAVFHSKHRSIGTGEKAGEIYLTNVDFVPRFALLLFGGELIISKNALVVDEWLKFKVGETNKSATGSLVLIQELRVELDNLLIANVGSKSPTQKAMESQQKQLIDFVRQLLADE